jgi:hypothetical protein
MASTKIQTSPNEAVFEVTQQNKVKVVGAFFNYIFFKI